MGNAASLFRDIKDIRDELNILKAVSESQDAVQGSLRYVQGQDPQTARSITREIREMDEIARRIQNAVGHVAVPPQGIWLTLLGQHYPHTGTKRHCHFSGPRRR